MSPMGRAAFRDFFSRFHVEMLAADAAAVNRRLRIILMLHIYVMSLCLPVTAGVLFGLAAVPLFRENPDVHGLLAVSTGILGVLVFFIFLFKYQTTALLDFRHRVLFLLLHATVTAVLFFTVIWLGFASPWHATPYWGSYDLNTAARSWVISVIVIGSITLLGSIFDLFRRLTSR